MARSSRRPDASVTRSCGAGAGRVDVRPHGIASGRSSRRRTLALALALLALPASAAGKPPEELRRWAEGPVRWLLQANEWKALRQVDGASGALAFVAAFWERRDPAPETEGNPFRETFSQRVEAADLLYGSHGLAGSLTDRGRALILLGSPTHVRIATEPSLIWDGTAGARRRVRTREVRVEVWGYRMDDLPRRLIDLVRETHRKSDEALELTLTFSAAVSETRLVAGENLLELAARAALRADP